MIPLKQPEGPKGPQKPQALTLEDLGPLRYKTVLIVDDEEDIRTLVALMLKSRGVKSIKTDTADSAIDILNQQSDEVAVVLLDLSVPNSSELPALERIRREHPNTPIIVMTGMAQTDAEVGRPDGGLVGYLRKPFRPDALYHALGQRGRTSDPARRRRRDSGERTSGETFRKNS